MASTPIDIAASKTSLRKARGAARDAISDGERAEGARRLAGIGLGFAGLRPGAWVSGYCAMGSEIDPLPLLERAARDGFSTCLPVVTPLGQPLVFRAWAIGELLVARTWGILEPLDRAPVVEPDALLVPLLAFDASGFRLGYGGGYYDRTLERLRRSKPIAAIGLAFAAQELDEVPIGPHDQRLDWVLTPEGARRMDLPPHPLTRP